MKILTFYIESRRDPCFHRIRKAFDLKLDLQALQSWNGPQDLIASTIIPFSTSDIRKFL